MFVSDVCKGYEFNHENKNVKQYNKTNPKTTIIFVEGEFFKIRSNSKIQTSLWSIGHYCYILFKTYQERKKYYICSA